MSSPNSTIVSAELPRVGVFSPSPISDRGTTGELTKFWMPLDEFTQHAMAGLERGDFQIFVPQTEEAWEAIEKGRIERCMDMGSNST